MSESSYWGNLALGVTGPSTNTCTTAAAERSDPGVRYDPATHLAMESYFEVTAALPRSQQNAAMTKMYDRIARQHGLDSIHDIGFERVHNEHETRLLLRKLFKLDMVVIADVDAASDPDQVAYDPEDNAHSVGIIPRSIYPESFVLRSTWLTKPLRGVLEPDDLFAHMVMTSDSFMKRYRFNDANMTFFPKSSASQLGTGWRRRAPDIPTVRTWK